MPEESNTPNNQTPLPEDDPARPAAFRKKIKEQKEKAAQGQTTSVEDTPQQQPATQTTPPQTQTPIQPNSPDPARPKAFQEKRAREQAGLTSQTGEPQAAKKPGIPISDRVRMFLQRFNPRNFKPIYLSSFIPILLAAGIFYAWRISTVESGVNPTDRLAMLEKYTIRKILIGGKTISAELANSPAKRTLGLMERDGLDEDKGMLFTFGIEGTYPFWMKNMKFPVDIIWINSDLSIVHIEANVPPCEAENDIDCASYVSETPAQYVLELPAGWTQKNNVSLGNTVEFVSKEQATE